MDSSATFIEDGHAFIFSLRRNGISTNEKYKIKTPKRAYYSYVFNTSWLIYFIDISVVSNSNIETGSYTDFGNSYEIPEGYTYGTGSARNYLSGNYNKWLTTEIEVFQLD